MTKNPFFNALGALAYITAIASIMFYGMNHNTPEESIAIPIFMLSLFTLSAAVMGYIFLSTPVRLYLDGKKKQGIDLFVKTILVFGSVTGILAFVLFSGVLS